jgi:hypothetical protein
MPLAFKDTLSWEDFLRALLGASTSVLDKDRKGPIFPIKKIVFKDLDAPEKTKKLIQEISTSGAVVDKSSTRKFINDDTLGAMRQIHANQPMYLPRLTYNNDSTKPEYLKGLSGRGKEYERYVKENKTHSNDRGGENDTTGYVEYTAGTNDFFRGGNRARICFDYVNGLVYFSPIHYAVWTAAGASFAEVEGKPVTGDYVSPWFGITDITSG